MAWCPSCKLEYVKGISVCPDCKSVLVESLDEVSDQETAESANGYEAEVFYSEDEEREAMEAQLEMMERMKKVMENPPYKSKEEKLRDNKSGALVLILFGIVGIVVLVLNGLGVIHLPMKGYSLTLVNIVMGFLFVVFLVSGVTSQIKIKKLIPEVEKEKEDIEKVINFIKEQKNNGEYKLDMDNYEVSYLEVSDKVVKDVEAAFPDLIKGFAFYVVDRFGSDILDED